MVELSWAKKMFGSGEESIIKKRGMEQWHRHNPYNTKLEDKILGTIQKEVVVPIKKVVAPVGEYFKTKAEETRARQEEYDQEVESQRQADIKEYKKALREYRTKQRFQQYREQIKAQSQPQPQISVSRRHNKIFELTNKPFMTDEFMPNNFLDEKSPFDLPSPFSGSSPFFPKKRSRI